MNLKRILLLASMALAAIAAAAPAAAQAQTHGLTEGQTWLTAGAPVTVTSTNLVTKSSLGTLTCQKVTLHYTVVTNTDEHVVLSPENVNNVPTTNATPEICVVHTTFGGTDTAHITEAGTDEVTFNTWGTGTAVSRYKVQVTGGLTCTYTGTVHIQAQNGTDTQTIGPSTLTSGCGNGTISGNGTVETSNGTEIQAHFKQT